MPILGRRHLTRYRQIAGALARHGLGWVVLELGLGDLIPFHTGLLGHPRREEPYTRPEHFRMALENVGAVFIKLGQMLSTRPDLLPPEYVTEFARLQDAAPPVPYDEIATVVAAELGARPEAIFARFDPIPRAAASLGQVHAATLAEGTPVVVKVQRPGVEEAVEQDLAVLADFAHLATSRTRLGEYYDVEAWVEEFAYTLRNELDYTREGHNADRLRQNFAAEPALRVPRVSWDLTTRRVLTMEEIRGIKINDLAALEAAGLDRRRVAENSVRIILTEVFEHGFFHADPHPGNFFVLPGEVIGLIDFGMVGRLDESLREALLRLGLALIRRDGDRLVDELLFLGVASGRVPRQALKRDLDHLVARYADRPISEWAAGEALNTVMAIAFRHHLQLPVDLALLSRVIAMSEGLGAQLDPDFQLMTFAAPYFRRFWLRQRSPDRVARRLAQGVLDLVDLGPELPQALRRLAAQLERGEITVTSRHEGLGEALATLNRAANRLAMSILTAALIIGLALLMLVYHPPGWETWGGWFFGLAFLLAVALGLWLLWSIWHAR
ncbi:MAG: AarF/ABC1/UbiB kinase family protein [Ardenticatenaceae bacterium]|nr:AarF/ABC1/UbiB kinase family protein [Ardenticatenaceae bacterium]